MEEESGNVIIIEFLPNTLRLLLICSNIFVSLFAICGNAIAIIVAAKSRCTSVFTKMCLLSLSLTDMLLTVTSTPIDLDQFMNCLHSWNFGEFVCKILPFLQFLALMVNSFSILALVVQRCWSTSILLANRQYNRAENPSLLLAGVIFGYIWLIPCGFVVPYMSSYNLNTYSCRYQTLDSLADNFEPVERFDKVSTAVVTCHGARGHGTNMTTGYCLEDVNVTYSVGICQQTNSISRTLLYHVASGVVLVALTGTFFRAYFLIRKMQKLENFYEKALPPRTLRNIELVQSIRKLLSCQRRGLRLILYMIGLYIVCRLPFELLVVIQEFGKNQGRSQAALSAYFTLHMVANVKGAITPFLYVRSSKVLRSNSYGIVRKSSGSCMSFPCRKYTFDVGFDENGSEG